MLSPVKWAPGGIDLTEGVDLIDQRLLPHELRINHYDNVRALSEAIDGYDALTATGGFIVRW